MGQDPSPSVAHEIRECGIEYVVGSLAPSVGFGFGVGLYISCYRQSGGARTFIVWRGAFVCTASETGPGVERHGMPPRQPQR